MNKKSNNLKVTVFCLILLIFPFVSFATPERPVIEMAASLVNWFLWIIAIVIFIADLLKFIIFLVGKKEKMNIVSHWSLALLFVSYMIYFFVHQSVFFLIFFLSIVLVFLFLIQQLTKNNATIIKNEPILPQLINIVMIFLITAILSIALLFILIFFTIFMSFFGR